jgi:hypothetical protein
MCGWQEFNEKEGANVAIELPLSTAVFRATASKQQLQR